MRILVACEFSGVVREAFRRRGHDAWSCDLINNEDESDFHFVADAVEVARHMSWDLMVAHPPCTYLSRAGARWWGTPERDALADAAAEFVFSLRDAPIPMIAIENPIGQLNWRWRYPDQVIQPYQFGEAYSKATCLWLKNLPPLMSTLTVARHVPFLPSNTGGAKRGQKATRGIVSGGKDASRTFRGIADAMAEQWGALEQAEAA